MKKRVIFIKNHRTLFSSVPFALQKSLDLPYCAIEGALYTVLYTHIIGEYLGLPYPRNASAPLRGFSCIGGNST